MQELTFEQVEEVSGGNPVVAMVAVVACRAAAPYAKYAVITAAAAFAGAYGYVVGSRSGEQE